MALSTENYGYLIDPFLPLTDEHGKTIKNGFVRVFMAGTSTPATTYANFDGTTNPESIELDNSGRTANSVISDKSALYKVCVYDAHHSQESPIVTKDNLSVISGGGGTYTADAPIRIFGSRITNNGYNLVATGSNAWAEGYETKSLSNSDHAEGGHSEASGGFSHAEGYETKATGIHSHAEGFRSTASGTQSHAEGSGTVASGTGSHAEGNGSVSSNACSHAEGIETEASQGAAHAEGMKTKATGAASHAEGEETIASGANSHAGGQFSQANGQNAFAHGLGVIAVNGEAVFGRYNDYEAQDSRLFSVGDGTDDSHRKTVFKVDASGNTWVMIGGVLTQVTSVRFKVYESLQDAISDAENLSAGDIFETNGFHASGDGGAARYLVSDTGTANGKDVVTLATGKYALFQWSNEVTPEQLGAVGDGSTDDTAIFAYIVNHFSSVLGDMQVKRTIRGSMGKRYKINALSVHDVCVSQCVFRGAGSTTGYGIRLGDRAIIEKCLLFEFINAIYTEDNDSAISAVVTGCTISWSGNGICLHSGTSQSKSVDNVLIENNYISRLGTLGHSSDSTPPNWDNTGCGIWLNGNWKNVNIVNNVLEYNGYTGLRLECNRTDLEPSCVVTENYFEGNKQSAIRIIMQKRPCMVSIFGNQMTKLLTNVFYTTGIYCTGVMSSGRIESTFGEYLGVASSNSGSDIISLNAENLKASNILIYPTDLTSDTFQLIPAKCANSTSERKMLHLDVYARSTDSSFTMSVSYVDENNITQTDSFTIDTNTHSVIEIPLISFNLYDSVNEPITCVVTSATWTYLMITDLWIK